MIKHIVMVKLKDYDPETKRTNLLKLQGLINGLTGKIPELKFMETGLNMSTKPSAYDLVLTSHFNSVEDLNTYRDHPEHQEVLKYFYEVTAKTAVVDYEVA